MNRLACSLFGYAVSLSLAWCSPFIRCHGSDAVPSFFATHCLRCHNDSTHEGDFRIDDMPQSIDDLSFGPRWSRAYERIISGEMPPKEEPQPSPKERYDATEWISLGIQAWDSAQNAKLERVSFKRLTREEYVNTIQDLLGYTYHPTDPGGLPEDPHWHGIERMGSVLSLTPSHVERYIAAAEQALQCVIPLSPPPQPWQWEWTAPGIINWNGYLQKLKQDSNTRKHRLLIGPANNWKHYVGGLNQIQVPYAGQYRITIVASGLRPQGGSVPHLVLYDATIDRTLAERDVDAPEESPLTMEFLVWLPRGSHDLVLRNELPGSSPYEPHQRGGNVDIFTNLKSGRSPFLEKVSDDQFRPYYPLLILDRVLIESVVDPWPPLAQQQVFSVAGQQDAIHAQSILRSFGERALRRPLSNEDIGKFQSIFETSRKTGLSFERAIRESILAMLCSHEFLFLVEGSTEEMRATLNDFELASRLSYFVWSTMPDEQLMQRARKGELRQKEVLRAEFDRMIQDPRAKRFAMDFSRQWLRLNEVGKFPPDKKLYPQYDAGLQRSMVAESQAFFEEVLTKNLSVREFLDSDWCVLNNRLGEHYGISGVADFHFRPVPVSREQHRGGLLTQASVLTMTSDGFRHRPVHRGKWISEVIFGIIPPPPPPNAGTIPATPEGATKTTLRAKLEAHRNVASCAACHEKIDPFGFAFENYDAIGRWRTVEDTLNGIGEIPVIDASGQLADGRTYTCPEDFKKLLLADTNKFATALTEKIATYALRRGLTFSDRQAIVRLVEQSESSDWRLRDLVQQLVLSDLFQAR